MRFRISLSKARQESFIPINYQYELSAAIYRAINRVDSAFSRFLHEEGYLAFGKKFRLFTFSRIFFDHFRVIKEAGRIHHHGEVAIFEISFLIDKAAEEFIKGIFYNQEFILGDKISKIVYQVSAIEAGQAPVFQEKMKYRCLSPIFVRRKRPLGGEDHLHPKDRDYGILLLQNLLSKSRALTLVDQREATLDEERFPDFNFKPLRKIYKEGVKIKQLTAQETQLIGYSFEFEFTAPIELQRIGFYAGFGHLGSQGFGCVEVRRD
ncbi:MAG: CRISPR-associated endoribonuclease Cas6 [Nitritalea sp.]